MKVISVEGHVLFLEPAEMGVMVAISLRTNPNFVFSQTLGYSDVQRCLTQINSVVGFGLDENGSAMVRADGCVELRLFPTGAQPINLRFLPTDSEAILAAFDSVISGEIVRLVAPEDLRLEWIKPPDVGRNEPCPCNSKQKFKKCCGAAANLRKLKKRLDPFRLATDQVVQEIIRRADRNPSCTLNPAFWNELGCFLGSAEEKDLAIEAFNHALVLAHGNEAVIANKALCLGQKGELEEALRILLALKNAHGEHHTTIGSTLAHMRRFGEAIVHYEKAIHAGHAEHQAYTGLIQCLELTGSSLVEYWINRAVRELPRSPSIAEMFCRHLLRENRLDELAEAHWIENLQATPYYGEFTKSSSESPDLVIKAQVFRLLGMCIHECEVRRLEEAVRLLEADVSFHLCECAWKASDLAARFGRRDLVWKATRRVCRACQDELGADRVQAWLAFASWSSGNYEEALADAEIGLKHSPQSGELLTTKLMALSELDRDEEALVVGQYARSVAPVHPMVNYNLGVVSGCLGQLGAAVHHYCNELATNPTNALAIENLAFIRLVEGNTEQAVELSKAWCIHAPRYLQAEEIELKKGKFDELLRAAQAKRGSTSLALELRELNDQSAPRFGAHLVVYRQPVSDDELVRILLSEDPVEKADAAFQIEMERRGDFSNAIIRLTNDLAEVTQIPKSALLSLVEAQRQFDSTSRADYAPAVLAFCKALEILLREHVFLPFQREFRVRPDWRRLISEAAQPEFTKALSFARFIEKGTHLELGGMGFTLQLCGGATGRRLAVLEEFNRFLITTTRRPALLDHEFTERVTSIARTFRNPAAHAEVFNRSETQAARAEVLSAMTTILRPALARGHSAGSS